MRNVSLMLSGLLSAIALSACALGSAANSLRIETTDRGASFFGEVAEAVGEVSLSLWRGERQYTWALTEACVDYIGLKADAAVAQVLDDDALGAVLSELETGQTRGACISDLAAKMAAGNLIVVSEAS